MVRVISKLFVNHLHLARRAKEKTAECDDTVIAVLFRDSDDSSSAGRGEWKDKWDSMKKGFEDEEFPHGVPMIPKPKSEVWLLCAVAKSYQHCDALENESGNDDSPNPLKGQLRVALDGEDSTLSQTNKVKDRDVDVTRIDMPSFNAFKSRLVEVVKSVVGGLHES